MCNKFEDWWGKFMLLLSPKKRLVINQAKTEKMYVNSHTDTHIYTHLCSYICKHVQQYTHQSRKRRSNK